MWSLEHVLLCLLTNPSWSRVRSLLPILSLMSDLTHHSTVSYVSSAHIVLVYIALGHCSPPCVACSISDFTQYKHGCMQHTDASKWPAHIVPQHDPHSTPTINRHTFCNQMFICTLLSQLIHVPHVPFALDKPSCYSTGIWGGGTPRHPCCTCALHDSTWCCGAIRVLVLAHACNMLWVASTPSHFCSPAHRCLNQYMSHHHP